MRMVVFRNVSDHGLIDIVGVKDGKAAYFDVKSSPNGYTTGGLTPEQNYVGILPLYVSASECWIGEPPRYPPYVSDPIDLPAALREAVKQYKAAG